MTRRHAYRITVEWTGDRGVGTTRYDSYGRDHRIAAEGRPAIAGSSDPAFRGDADRWNPEQLLIASIAACHKLWYLHLCAVAGVTVLAYRDDAEGTMTEDMHGGGRFTSVTLRPKIILKGGDDVGLAAGLHVTAHERCFIANSVNFPVLCEPEVATMP